MADLIVDTPMTTIRSGQGRWHRTKELSPMPAEKVRCDGAGTLKATFKTKLEKGRWLRASIGDGPTVQVFIGSRGRGKAKWNDLPGGTYKVCVVECPDRCRKTDCD